MDVSLGGVEFLVGKIEMVEDKNQNCIGPSPHNFRVNLQQNNPLKLVVICTVRVIISNCIAGLNKLYITDATAPTPERSFGDFVDILSKSVKESMGQ